MEFNEEPMSNSLTRLTSLWAAALLPAMLGACGCAETSPPSDGIGVSATPLAAYDFASWTAWTMPINTCFIKDTRDPATTPTAAQYTALKSVTLAGLQESWGLVPGVSFSDKDDCGASPPSSYLKLLLGWAPGYGGWCGAGVGATCEFAGGTDTQAHIDQLKGTAVHEVGHALGLLHEHQRIDGDRCQHVLADGCVRCKTSLDAGQACAVQDWNDCNEVLDCDRTTPLYPSQMHQQYCNTKITFYQKIEENIGNNATWDVLASLYGITDHPEPMTTYDPLSIMNYCAGNNGRASTDYHPTSLDLLGLEMIYPSNHTYPIGCSSACFYTGSGVITRQSNGRVTTDWMTRGALNVSLIHPVTKQSSTQLETQTLPAGSSTLTFNFKAPRTGALLSTSGALVNSDASHAALVMSIAYAL